MANSIRDSLCFSGGLNHGAKLSRWKHSRKGWDDRFESGCAATTLFTGAMRAHTLRRTHTCCARWFWNNRLGCGHPRRFNLVQEWIRKKNLRGFLSALVQAFIIRLRLSILRLRNQTSRTRCIYVCCLMIVSTFFNAYGRDYALHFCVGRTMLNFK